jgi:hypothetical protein
MDEPEGGSKDMNAGNTLRTAGALLLLGLISLSGCSEVNNTDNFAVVTGRVLNSPEDPTGVPGVVVWVESDPTSETAYLGGDVSAVTAADGRFEASIHLGYITIRDRPEEGGSGTFSPEFPQYVGDARLLLLYEDTMLDLGGGFTLERGETLEIWDVYLTQFVPVGADTTGPVEAPPVPGR